jgi:hypothetical protein
MLKYVTEKEKNSIMRVGQELLSSKNVTEDAEQKPKAISRTFTSLKMKEHEQRYVNKKMHGYFYRKLTSDQNVDLKLSHRRTTASSMTSQFEGYITAIHDQEIPTKYLKHKRQVDAGLIPTTNNKCRLCKTTIEDVNHVICSCPGMSARYYLPLRHDAVAKYLLKVIIQNNHAEMKHQNKNEPEYVIKIEKTEYWWNLPIKTATKIPHNKPDLLVWDTDQRICTVIEFSCPGDINIVRKTEEKLNTYGPLIRNLQIMYPTYKFQMVPIIVGALGYVAKSLRMYMKQLGFNEKEALNHIRKMQNISAAGTVKICKTFLSFKE